MLILGTRPQILKSAPIINESLNHAEIDLKILHTGQHYDDYMSDVFFRDLCENFILDNLNIGPGSSPTQIGSMIKGIENSINEINPDLVLIPGDTNSAISAAITASKMNVELAHFEAGARLGVSLYPEEINRRMIDQAADLLLTPSIHCKKNLKKENLLGEVVFVGDTMYDLYKKSYRSIRSSTILDRYDLNDYEYSLLTLHRPNNVDSYDHINEILKNIIKLNDKIIFPIHPRTKKHLIAFNMLDKLQQNNIQFIDPVNYYDMQKLISKSKVVLTDSGGVQKEAFWAKRPCITLRPHTVWIETVNQKANHLINDFEDIPKIYGKLLSVNAVINWSNPYGKGNASSKILNEIKKYMDNVR